MLTKIKIAIEIDKHFKASESHEIFESLEEIYIAVHDLCDKDEHLKTWGNKTYILDALTAGFKKYKKDVHV